MWISLIHSVHTPEHAQAAADVFQTLLSRQPHSNSTLFGKLPIYDPFSLAFWVFFITLRVHSWRTMLCHFSCPHLYCFFLNITLVMSLPITARQYLMGIERSQGFIHLCDLYEQGKFKK